MSDGTVRRRLAAAAMAMAVAAWAGAGRASADLIASDSYAVGTNPAAGQYQNLVSLVNQPATLVNAGFVDGRYASGTGTANFRANGAAGLSYAPIGADSSTGGVEWIGFGNDNQNRSNARNLSPFPPASSPTYWINHLVRRSDVPTSGNDGYVLTGFGNTVAPILGTTSGFLSGLFVGFSQSPGRPGDFGSLVIRHRDTTGMTSTDAILVDGSTTSTFGLTYDVVMRVDVNVSGALDRVNWWLNPTDFSSQAALNGTALASGSFDSFALQGPGDLIRLNYAARNWNGTANLDEARLSTTLAGLVAIPEPSSLALLAAGGLTLALASLRRPRRA